MKTAIGSGDMPSGSSGRNAIKVGDLVNVTVGGTELVQVRVVRVPQDPGGSWGFTGNGQFHRVESPDIISKEL